MNEEIQSKLYDFMAYQVVFRLVKFIASNKLYIYIFRDNKKLAYLLDMKTICVVDLIQEITIAQINHNSKIDWIELNETSQKLLFRDKKMRLYLVDITNGKKQLLLPKAFFVQWVIQSDVVVAQTDNMNLAIWYNIDLPEHITLMTVRGEVTEIIRENV